MELPKKKNIFIFLLILITFISSFLFIKDCNKFVDERAHHGQIEKFMKKDFTLRPDLATIPGYHAFFAILSSILHIPPKLPSMRLLSSIFSLISVLVFYILSLKVSKDTSGIKTLQYYFFPILFPFFFLIYTDVFSLLLVLTSFYFLLKDRYDYAGFLAILTFLVRQNNIVWIAFMCMYIYHKNYGWKSDFEILKDYLDKCGVFILGFIIFALFLLINQGFAVGSRSAHPAFSFHMGNIYFMLFLFFFLFLPLNISNFPKIISLIMKSKIILVGILLIFFIYMGTFSNTHFFNQLAWFIRNRILVYFTSATWLKALFFIPIIYSILSLSVTILKNKSVYLLYPFTFIFLVPSWLIEQRYYLIPLTLFILFKEEKTKLIEYGTIIIYIIVSLLFFYGIRENMFFL